jgi:hypothetical protein
MDLTGDYVDLPNFAETAINNIPDDDSKNILF